MSGEAPRFHLLVFGIPLRGETRQSKTKVKILGTNMGVKFEIVSINLIRPNTAIIILVIG